MKTIKPSEARNGGAGPTSKVVQVTAPNMQQASFKIIGNAPLVLHRFSAKAKKSIRDTAVLGKVPSKHKVREKLNIEEAFNQARYTSKDGWDGFNVACIRCAMVSACRLVNFKMTIAKLSLFVKADGRDATEPEFGLVRIYGNPRILESICRVETGQPYLVVRPIYDEWHAIVRVQFDADQFDLAGVANLLSRVGSQVGIGEGRPDSRASTGMGWGTFDVESAA